MTAETARTHPSLSVCQTSSASGCARYVGRVGALAVALGVGMAIATGQGMGIARADDANPNPVSSETGGQQGEDTDTTPLTPLTDPAPISEQAPTADAKLDHKPRDLVDRLVPRMRMRINVSGGARVVGVHTDKKESPLEAANDFDTEKAIAPDLTQIVKDTSQQRVSRRIDRQTAPSIKVETPVVAAPTIRSLPRPMRPQVRLQSQAAVTAGSPIDLKPAATKQQITTAAVRVAPAVAPTRPVAPLQAVAATALRVVNDALAAVWSPTAAPAPGTPRAPQPILLAVLGWIRREVQTAVFNRTPQIAPQQDISLHLRKPTDVATIDLKELGAKDADDDVLTYSTPARGQTGGPTKGTVTVDKTTGVLTYDPDDTVKPGDKDTFTVTVSDANSPAHLHGLFGFLRPDAGHTTTSTITVTISNKAPVGTANELAIDEDTTISVDAQSTLNPLHNDSDPDGDPLTAVKVSDPSHGTLELNPDGSFTYSPEENYYGPDSFTYTVADGFTKSEPVKFTITVKPVNDLPVTKADTYDTDEDKTLIVAIDKGVLANDSDIDKDVLTAVVETNPGKGAVALNGNGSFTYTPNPNENGDDAFSYTVKDGTGSSAPVTVTIHIAPVNDAPVVEIGHFDVDEDTVLTGNFLAFASDVDGDHLTVVSARADNGTLDPIADGTTAFVFHPLSNAAGPAAINYVITDGKVNVKGQIRITIKPVNDPPEGKPDVATTGPGEPVTIDVLANDTDLENNVLSIDPNTIVQPTGGSVALHDGKLTYTPKASFSGTETFTYRAFDGKDLSAPIPVTVTVTPGNRAPVATAEKYTVNMGATLQTGTTVNGLLFNDTDPDGDPMQVVIVAQPQHAAASGITSGGQITYTPAAGYHGPDSITYYVVDSKGARSETVTATIRVNQPPVAQDENDSTTMGHPKTVAAKGVLSNDSDPDGDPIHVVGVTPQVGQHGTIDIKGDGSLTFTPTSVGTDIFTYTISDDFATATGHITFTVSGPNPPPRDGDDGGGRQPDEPPRGGGEEQL